MDVLKRLFEKHFGLAAERVEPLQGQLGGSGRNIVRLANEPTSAIGIFYGVREENVAFVEFSRTFRRNGLPVPQIYAEDLAQDAYLEEDLGDLTLFQFLSQNRHGEDIAPEVVEAYRKVVTVLPRFQVEMRDKLNYKVCYPRASFDRQSIAWDLNYFKYYFLRLAGSSVQRAGAGERFRAADEVPAGGRPRVLSLSRFPVAQRDAGGGRAVFSRLPGRAQGRAAIRHCLAAV